MFEWIAWNWWVVWAAFVVVAIMVFRMRRHGGDEFLPRRILLALFPHADPRDARRRDVTPAAIVATFAGPAVVALALAVTAWLRPQVAR